MSEASTVVVTGASSGIGAAIAAELARRGYWVACLSRRGVAPTVADVPQERLVPIACDIGDPASVEAAMKHAAEITGSLAGVVNNAGMQKGGASRSFSLEDFNEVMKTNVLGTFSMSQAAYPYLEERGRGLIINVGSFWDKIGGKAYTAYCASKAAVGAVSRCLAVEWAKKGIRVLNVAPGYIHTEMTGDYLETEAVKSHLGARIPGGQVGQPKDVAKLIAALFVEDIDYLTGSTIYIDGGQGIAP